MFNGIVEGTGRVLKIEKIRGGARLRIRPPFSLVSTPVGGSIAINGCCVTVVARNVDRVTRGKVSGVGSTRRQNLFEVAGPDPQGPDPYFEADLSHETLRVTNLGALKEGDPVNLERPMRLSDRIGGHLVQGHVDGVGQVLRVRRFKSAIEIEIGFPKKLRRYLIPKGSVAVDGISMTVNRLKEKSFTLVVIPHTLRKTNLKGRRAGDRVNLEVDLIGKYVESLSRK